LPERELEEEPLCEPPCDPLRLLEEPLFEPVLLLCPLREELLFDPLCPLREELEFEPLCPLFPGFMLSLFERFEELEPELPLLELFAMFV